MSQTIRKSIGEKFFVRFFCFLIIGFLSSVLFSVAESLGIVESDVVWGVVVEHGDTSGCSWRRIQKK